MATNIDVWRWATCVAALLLALVLGSIARAAPPGATFCAETDGLPAATSPSILEGSFDLTAE